MTQTEWDRERRKERDAYIQQQINNDHGPCCEDGLSREERKRDNDHLRNKFGREYDRRK